MESRLSDCAAQARRKLEPLTASLDLGDVEVTRTRHDGGSLEKAAPIPRSDAFSVIVQLRPFRRHRLWRDGELVYDGGHAAAALAITDLRRQWQCHHLSAFDNLRFRIPFSQMNRFVEEAGQPNLCVLSAEPETTDEVMLGLAQALLPALGDPANAHPLFLEQMRLALLAHLTRRYGGLQLTRESRGTLSLWQEKRIVEYMVAHFDKPISIAQLAGSCGLSRSYFIKAFTRSFGRTPHRWLTEYRIKKARELLESDVPLAEIALACGFADQSHFTRVFSQRTGETPARYRRPRQSS
ncbi:AraC family transcriptional regulator [Breoghania sp. JC706]|uniref:AraC family transcriptional regulator n=1 Tax=Breoghania sp. JC706 TaxID=3117732 RepID=UPI0030090EE1